MLIRNEFSQTREQALNNLLGMSTAWLGASQRLADLFAAAGRDALHLGSKQLPQFGHGQFDSLTNLPTTLWLESSIRNTRLLDAAYEILGESHRSLIQSAEAQVRVFDEIVSSSIYQIAKINTRDDEPTPTTMRSMLKSAEIPLHWKSEAASLAVQLTSNQDHQISESLTENSPTTRPNRRGRTIGK